MKLKRTDVLVAIIAVFVFINEAYGEEPWYAECKKSTNFTEFSLCTTMNNPYVQHPCDFKPQGFNADGTASQPAEEALNRYRCLVACASDPGRCQGYAESVGVPLTDYVAPNGATWKDNFYNADINRRHYEACTQCLKIAKNRNVCRGC